MANDLELRVGAKTQEAHKGLSELGSSVKRFAEEAKSATKSTSDFGGSFTKMAGAMTLGSLAADAIKGTLQFLRQEMIRDIDAFKQLQSAMIGISSVASAFGESQTEARDAAKSLAEDGLMSVAEAATGLKNLLASGFSLPEAINLMNTFKDSAAFNRQGTLQFGEAIVGATIGIKNQNSILVDNVGITKNLSIILKEAGLSQNDLMRVTSDASVRQKLYNGLLREGSVFAGDAARASETLGGAQSRLNTQLFNLRATIGSALAPAMTFLADSLATTAQNANNGLSPALVNVAKAGVYAVGVLKEMGLIIKTILQPVFEVAKTSVNNFIVTLKGMAKVVSEILQGKFKSAWETLTNTGQTIAENTKTSVNAIVDNFKSFIPESVKIAEDIGLRLEKINTEGLKGFTDTVRAAVNIMTDGLDEEAKKVAEKIAKEMKSFAKSITALTKDFQENMRDLVISHKEKTANIQKQIAEEKEAWAELQEQIKDKHAEEMQQFKKAAQERLASLQRQLDREKAKGDKADQEKVTALEEMLVNEKISLEEQLKLKEDLIQKEIDKEKEAHDEKMAELQSELDAEIEIQKKHEEEFAALKDAVKEDDISRLKRKFAEEKQLMIEEHEDRLEEIRKEAKEEAEARNSSSTSAGTTSGGSTGNKEPTFEQAFPAIYKGWDRASALQNFLATGGKDKAGYDELKRSINGYAMGGVVRSDQVARVGEDGPEAIIPLNKPERARQVMNEAGMNREINITMPVTVLSSDIDLDNLVERLAFKMKTAGVI